MNIKKSELTVFCMMNRKGSPSDTENKDFYLQQVMQSLHFEYRGILFLILPVEGPCQGRTGNPWICSHLETQSGDQRSY